MRRLSFRLLALAFSTVISSAALAGGDNDSQTLKQISDYRQWTKMNPEPLKVDSGGNFAVFAGG